MLGGDVPAITPEDMNLPAVIYEMACQAATICSPGNNYSYHLHVLPVENQPKVNFYTRLCKNGFCKTMLTFKTGT